jgi:predicted membrane chloride channel (bestrophin family)
VAAVAAGVLAANAALAQLARGAFDAGWRVALPMAPFTLSSPALCLLLVFRTNAAYARWCVLWRSKCV